MTLIDNAERVLKRAWSVRWMLACFVVIASEPIVNTIATLVIGQSLLIAVGMSVLAGFCAVAAILARITVQKDFGE
jgi:hypothetical protein